MKSDQSFKFTHVAITLLTCLMASQAISAPCKDSASCEIDASASMIAPIDVFLSKCASANPNEAEAYQAHAQKLFSNSDPLALEKVRASDAYASFAKQTEQKIRKLHSGELLKACDRMLAKKQQ